MKTIISYSHQDNIYLDRLHVHLAQLQRDGLISAWTDRDILAGDMIDDSIIRKLEESQLFLALVSPDYIASNYCYDKEFDAALKRQEKGEMIIVPVIVRPCDWMSTPFNKLKALPKDGKAVSTWDNMDNAFLTIIQELRKLLNTQKDESAPGPASLAKTTVLSSKNYKVKKDFDSIEKMEYMEKSFEEISERLKRYMGELEQEVENVKTRILNSNKKELECLLVNRNKIGAESTLKISIGNEQHRGFGMPHLAGMQINYSITGNQRPGNNSFLLNFDEYHLFWIQIEYAYGGSREAREWTSLAIAELIWKEWLESVGIM